MAFPKGKQSPNGLSKTFGNTIPEDENSNNVPKGGKTIGAIKGAVSFSKSKVTDLNRGEWGMDTSTKAPGEAP